MSKAFQFTVKVDGISLVTRGLAQEWPVPPTFFLTSLGLVTNGLVVGKGDFWQYADIAVDPGWVVDDI